MDMDNNEFIMIKEKQRRELAAMNDKKLTPCAIAAAIRASRERRPAPVQQPAPASRVIIQQQEAPPRVQYVYPRPAQPRPVQQVRPDYSGYYENVIGGKLYRKREKPMSRIDKLNRMLW
jgi:hypothetical protein